MVSSEGVVKIKSLRNPAFFQWTYEEVVELKG